MKHAMKTAGFGAALLGLSACGATTEQEFVSAIGFALAQEAVRQNPAVVNRYEGSANNNTSFTSVANSGAATYSGSLAFYDSFTGINGLVVDDLDDADLMAEMNIQVNIGATRGTIEGEATDFVTSSGTLVPGQLTMTDGRIVSGITGKATITGNIGGTLSREVGNRLYGSSLNGSFLDGDENLVAVAGSSGVAGTSDAFSVLIAATRN